MLSAGYISSECRVCLQLQPEGSRGFRPIQANQWGTVKSPKSQRTRTQDPALRCGGGFQPAADFDRPANQCAGGGNYQTVINNLPRDYIQGKISAPALEDTSRRVIREELRKVS